MASSTSRRGELCPDDDVRDRDTEDEINHRRKAGVMETVPNRGQGETVSECILKCWMVQPFGRTVHTNRSKKRQGQHRGAAGSPAR